MADKVDDIVAGLFFHGAISDALKALQLLELIMKGYLEDVYWVANRARPGGIPFLLTERDLANMPLGSLLRLFRRHSENEWLLKTLRRVERGRIHITHRAHLLNIDKPVKNLAKARKAATVQAAVIGKLAQQCTTAIIADLQRLRAAVPADQRNPDWK